MAKATARHILVDTEEQCQSLKDEISGGSEFADLAKEHSSCPSGQKGGDLGEFGPGMMVREFDEVVFSADIGSVEGPVKTQFGYHIIQYNGSRTVPAQTLDQVYDAISAQLQDQKKRDTFKEIFRCKMSFRRIR